MTIDQIQNAIIFCHFNNSFLIQFVQGTLQTLQKARMNFIFVTYDSCFASHKYRFIWYRCLLPSLNMCFFNRFEVYCKYLTFLKTQVVPVNLYQENIKKTLQKIIKSNWNVQRAHYYKGIWTKRMSIKTKTQGTDIQFLMK